MRLYFIILSLSLIVFLQGCAAAYDHRGLDTIIDDQRIELRANAALRNDKAIHESSHINVISYNGIVLLTGETPSRELKEKAAKLVTTTPAIRQVYNELGLLMPSSIASRSKDTWITTKIKAKMIAHKGISPARVKVITERGTVYLLGLLTPQEAHLAVTIARQTEGVQRVVKIFEYLPQTTSE